MKKLFLEYTKLYCYSCTKRSRLGTILKLPINKNISMYIRLLSTSDVLRFQCPEYKTGRPHCVAIRCPRRIRLSAHVTFLAGVLALVMSYGSVSLSLPLFAFASPTSQRKKKDLKSNIVFLQGLVRLSQDDF